MLTRNSDCIGKFAVKFIRIRHVDGLTNRVIVGICLADDGFIVVVKGYVGEEVARVRGTVLGFDKVK